MSEYLKNYEVENLNMLEHTTNIESPALQADSLPSEPQGSPLVIPTLI